MAGVLDEIFALYRRNGNRRYAPEGLSQLQHALQCAQLAERFGATSPMIAAALLHDYGHLLETNDEAPLVQGRQNSHAAVGARHLSAIFPPSVTEPIRLHVTAKRHLCAVDQHYFEALSPGSLLTLKSQGGLLSASETRAFLAEPHAQAAILLRRWDDMSKDPAATTPAWEHFRLYLQEALARPSADVAA